MNTYRPRGIEYQFTVLDYPNSIKREPSSAVTYIKQRMIPEQFPGKENSLDTSIITTTNSGGKNLYQIYFYIHQKINDAELYPNERLQDEIRSTMKTITEYEFKEHIPSITP